MALNVKRIPPHIRAEMNDGGAGRRKYPDEEILSRFVQGESSETIRQASAE